MHWESKVYPKRAGVCLQILGFSTSALCINPVVFFKRCSSMLAALQEIVDLENPAVVDL